MKWLITGAGGKLGRALLAELTAEGVSADAVAAPRREALDITDARSVRTAVERHDPDIVVNCAAWTAVERAEDEERQARRVNGDAVRYLVEACRRQGSRLVHVSTDYVFGGERRTPYPEDAMPAPRNAYGRSKLAGEHAVRTGLPDRGVVLRTAWLHGGHGRDFVRTMLAREASQDVVDVVDDQWGQPTRAADVAARIVELSRLPAATGVFHATNAGATTWNGFCREIFRLIGADPGRVRRISSAALAGPVQRPEYTVLGHGRWAEVGLTPLPHWRDALRLSLPTPARVVPGGD
jgi:dTDP-4-dehydrorhamnose reductase